MNGHTWQLRLQICCLALCWRRVCWNFYHRTQNCPDCSGTKIGPWPPGIWPSVSPGFGQRAYSWRRCDQRIIPHFRFHKKFLLYSEPSNISTGTLINSGKTRQKGLPNTLPSEVILCFYLFLFRAERQKCVITAEQSSYPPPSSLLSTASARGGRQ